MATRSYSALRRDHLVLALRSLSRRQQTSIALIVAILGPTTVGMLQGLAAGLRAVASPDTPPLWRLAAWFAWLVVTGLVVLALREPVFMLAARPFLRMLPIPRRRHFACDVRSIAIAYSFLWLPIGYFLWETWSSPGALVSRLDATLVVVAGLVVAMSVQALALQPRACAGALVAFGAAAFCMAPSVAWPGSWFVLLSALALCGLALTLGYERPPAVRATFPVAPRVTSVVAAWSGLAIPVAWRDLRHAIGLRLAVVIVAMAAGSWLAQEGGFCGRRTGLYIVECAVAALALYRIPVLIDERLRESLPWIFRLAAARGRSLAAALSMTVASFAVAVALGAQAWMAACAAFPRDVIAAAFGIALAILAGVAFRWKEASGWVSIVSMLLLAFALGEAW